jgi:Mg-chelatase subunit ChlD
VTTLDTYPLKRLRGEARDFAAGQHARLGRLERTDLETWVDVVELASERGVRDRRAFYNVALEGLLPLSDHPGLRLQAHTWVLHFTQGPVRLATSFLRLCRDLIPNVTEDDFREIAESAAALERDVDAACAFMDLVPTVLARRDIDHLRAWHRGALDLAARGRSTTRAYLEAGAEAMRWLDVDDLPVLADLGARVAARSRHAARTLFRVVPSMSSGLSFSKLVHWVETGLALTSREDDLVLFLSYGPERDHEAVQVLCREISFSAFRNRVSLLLEAFLGRPASVRSMYELIDAAEVPPDVPAFTDGERLYIRPTLGCGTLPPLSLYKLVAMHAAGHDRFGGLGESELAARLSRLQVRLVAEGRAPSDLDRFLFGVAEDFRVDAALLHTLPGLRSDAEVVIRETYRPYSVDETGGVSLAPASLRAHAASFPHGVRILADHRAADGLEGILAPLASPEARPADSVRVTDELKFAFGEHLLAAVMPDDRPGADRSGLRVPHPPFHDHLFLGMAIASRGGPETDDQAAGPVAPGTPIEVPGSLHPSEVDEGLRVAAREPEEDASLPVVGDVMEEEVGDLSGESFTYHEWDAELGDFRPAWCTVRHREVASGDPAFIDETLARHRGELLLIRRQFERLRPDRIRRFFRQQDGDELDLDALIEAVVDARAGAPMTDSVFVRRDKKQRDVAVLFLLDMSDSTDQVITDGQRVIDVEKAGLVLLSEAIDQLGDAYGVMGFSSKGRNCVEAFWIKEFDEEFDATVACRVAGVEPCDYTRLGTALRHATERLVRVEAGVRLIVLLSDGRPYDVGYGDIRYAMEDTKAALTEAGRSGVKVFCITVDPEGPKYLEEMFGAHRFTVIQNVEHLPTKLPRIYRNLTV